MRKLILILLFAIIWNMVLPQTSDIYIKRIDSLNSIKTQLQSHIEEINEHINILRNLINEEFDKQQGGQLYVFSKDGTIYDAEKNYNLIGQVKKGTKVVFVKNKGEMGSIIVLDGEEYYVAKNNLELLTDWQKMENEQEIVDSLLLTNLDPYIFSKNGELFKSKNDFYPDTNVSQGTRVLFVKDINGQGIANCLVLYNRKQYFAFRSELVPLDQFHQELEEKEVLKGGRKKYKQSLIDKYGLENAKKILETQLWIGMSQGMLYESWGNPDDITRSVTASKVSEIWTYGKNEIYIENEIVTSWKD